MVLKLLILFISLLAFGAMGLDIQLQDYINDMASLKDDFDNIHNTYEQNIQELQITEFRAKVAHLIPKFQDQETLINEAIEKSNAEINRVFGELQRIDNDLVNTRNNINENEIFQHSLQNQMDQQQREYDEYDRQAHESQRKADQKKKERNKCGWWTLGICTLADKLFGFYTDEINKYRNKANFARQQVDRLRGEINAKKDSLNQLYSTRNSLEEQSRNLQSTKENNQNFQHKAIPWIDILKGCLMWLQRLQIPLNGIDNNNQRESNNTYVIQKLMKEYDTYVESYEEVMAQANEYFSSEGTHVLTFVS